MAYLAATGPCQHGVINEICWECTDRQTFLDANGLRMTILGLLRAFEQRNEVAIETAEVKRVECTQAWDKPRRVQLDFEVTWRRIGSGDTEPT